MNWNSVLWGKTYFELGPTRAKAEPKSFVPAWQAQRTNQGRTPLICTPWVPIHLSFNSQQGPPLVSLVLFHKKNRNLVAWAQGVTKRCRLSWLTNSALIYEPKCGGGWLGCGESANEYSCTYGAQINFVINLCLSDEWWGYTLQYTTTAHLWLRPRQPWLQQGKGGGGADSYPHQI
jgi:hypothetical protein